MKKRTKPIFHFTKNLKRTLLNKTSSKFVDMDNDFEIDESQSKKIQKDIDKRSKKVRLSHKDFKKSIEVHFKNNTISVRTFLNNFLETLNLDDEIKYNIITHNVIISAFSLMLREEYSKNLFNIDSNSENLTQINELLKVINSNGYLTLNQVTYLNNLYQKHNIYHSKQFLLNKYNKKHTNEISNFTSLISQSEKLLIQNYHFGVPNSISKNYYRETTVYITEHYNYAMESLTYVMPNISDPSICDIHIYDRNGLLLSHKKNGIDQELDDDLLVP